MSLFFEGKSYRNGVISHLGAISSASAKYAHFLNDGLSVTILSNREVIKIEFSVRQIYYTIATFSQKRYKH